MAKGHSRIPVYAGEKDNIIGLLLVRNLHQNQLIGIESTGISIGLSSAVNLKIRS